MEWNPKTAPTLEEFERLTADAWARLPEHFRDRCRGVLIRVEDLAPDDVLTALDIQSPYHLLGLYHGVSLDRKSIADVASQPDMVFLYRRAILESWRDGDDSLEDLVMHVLVHEIGHHFGLSDDDMEAIEAAADS